MKIEAVCPYGAPDDPSVWSGTPSNVVRALEEAGHQVTCHDVSVRVPLLLRYGFALLNSAIGFGPRYPYRVGPWRWLVSAKTARLMSRLPASSTVLHLGWDHLPLTRRHADMHRHVLFTDYAKTLMVTKHYTAAKIWSGHRKASMRQEAKTIPQMWGLALTSKWIKNEFEKLYGPLNKAVVVRTGFKHLGPPSQVRSVGTSEAPISLIFVAKHSFVSKGGSNAIKLQNACRAAGVPTRLTIIGNEENSEEMPYRRLTSGRSDVIWENWDTPQFSELLASADLFVGLSESEPYGLIYLECLGLGTPPIAYRDTPVSEFADNGRSGILAERGEDFRPLVARLAEIYADPSSLVEMSESGCHYVRSTYTWARCARELGQLLTDKNTTR